MNTLDNPGRLARGNYQVRALERALDILECFTPATPELSLTDIAKKVSLSTSTALRLLAVLHERGYVERSPDTDRYRIGVRALELGSVYLNATTLISEARPYLEWLARECQQTANLAVLSEGEIVHIAVVAPDRPIRFNAYVGQRDGAHFSGLGKVLLAELPQADLRALVQQRGLERRTRRTITTLEALELELAQVREQGYAIDDEESAVGVRCVAAAIRNERNEAVAAVSISGPANELRDEVLPSYIDAVKHAAQEISRRLGNGVFSVGNASLGRCR